MRTLRNARALVARAALVIAGVASAAGAQLPNANPAATALSDAFIARARGYDAVAWNPANLGMPGNPRFSIGLLALQAASGLDPISLSDLAPYSDKDLPAAAREQWLQKVTANGGEHGSMNGGLTFLGLSAGPFALQVASSVGVSANLSPDVAEAVLFGNAGRTGTVKDFAFQGSKAHAVGFTTGALSFGRSLGTDPVTGSRLSVGGTFKYIAGNFIGIAQDNGSTTTSDAMNVNFPSVYSRPDSDWMAGSGYGLDLGMTWRKSSKLTVGATVQNVFNTFAWDESKLYSQKGVATFTTDENVSDFDSQPYASAPASLRDAVKNDKFKPIVGVGLAYAMHSSLILSADARQQMGDGIQLGPKMELGGGAEYRGLPLLRLRGGASIITDGWGVSGGAGIEVFGYELGLGGAMRTVNGGKEPVITLNLLSIK